MLYSMTWMTQLLVCLSIVTVSVFLWRWRSSKRARAAGLSESSPRNVYEVIEPLTDFDWVRTEPEQLRAFKPKYHLSMSLEQTTFSEFIAMDKTYRDRCQARRQIMSEHVEETVQCNDRAIDAVNEFYSWMVQVYLPQRFPTIYRPENDPASSKPALYNSVLNEYIPIRTNSARDALRILGAHVDTDFLLLLPSTDTKPDDQPIYHLEAFVLCMPTFSTLDKLGRPVAEIHGAIPGYKEKLEKSLDRFFARLECGRIVKRANWGVQTDSELFTQKGSHLYSPDSEAKGGRPTKLDVRSQAVQDAVEQQKQAVDVEKCRFRSERQTLHRLPQSKAIMFAFKTYQYRFSELKAEGSGPAFIEAIEGLGRGSVPDIKYYKRGTVWGEKIAAYLRD